MSSKMEVASQHWTDWTDWIDWTDWTDWTDWMDGWDGLYYYRCDAKSIAPERC